MSGGTVATGLATDELRRLAEVLETDEESGRFLDEALDAWRRALGTEGLAAYLPAAGGYSRCAVAGGGGFPATLDPSAHTPLPARKVGVGIVLATSGFDTLESSPDPETECSALLVAAALQMRQLERRVRQRDFEARYRGVETEVLNELGSAITTTLDLDVLSEGVLLRAVSMLDARRGALYLRDDDGYRLAAAIGGSAAERLEEPEISDLDADRVLPQSQHHLTAPIEIDHDPRGLIALADKESRTGVGPFGDADRRTLALFASQAALAIEQARLHREALEKERLEREMELASDIQRGILPPSVPSLEGFDLFVWTRPARHVGGDYHDVIPIDDSADSSRPSDADPDRLAVVIADVTGKGVPAALLVSTLHGALRLLVSGTVDHSGLCRRLNEHLIEFSSSNKFATLFLAELTANQDEIRFVNAGHDPGLLMRDDGEIERLGASGVPLGLIPTAEHERRSVRLEAGELLCLYSDGITEARDENGDGEEFGVERLCAVLSEHRGEPLTAIRDAVDDALVEFTAGAPQGDDQTLVLVRRSGG